MQILYHRLIKITIFDCRSNKTIAEVINSNYNETLNGVVFHNLIKTQHFRLSGDRGGLVYTYKNNKNYPVSIIKATNGTNNSLTAYSLCVKASKIDAEMDIHPY